MALASTIQPSTVSTRAWPPSADVDEKDLVLRSQAGDVDAFNLLVEHYQNRIFALCFRMLDDRDAADDAAQEVFLSAFRGLRGYHGGSFTAWLLRIAKNECYDQIRARRHRSHPTLDTGAADAVLFQVQDPGEAPDDRLMRAELAQELQRRIEELEADQQLAVILSDIHGYRYDEIVAATGWPLGTVKSRLSRGRAQLRAVLQAEGGGLAW
jgi:RNA polymerase sigma-70 factor (ECF subfamily)